MLPRTRYANSDGVSIAYQLLSDAGPTFIQVPGAISNLALEDTAPAQVRYYERLTRHARVIRFDKRGTGLSDRGLNVTTVDQQVADIEAIFQATNTERATVCGLSHGGALAVLYAATYPERVEKLILQDAICADAYDPFSPMTDRNVFVQDWVVQKLEQDFESFIQWFARAALPDGNPDILAATMAFMQATASPAIYRSIFRGLQGLDLRPMLRRIVAPTLVIHAGRDALVPVSHGRYLAEHIPNAQYVEPQTTAHIPWFDDAVAEDVFAAMETFLMGGYVHTKEPVVVSVLFADIVDSTAQQKAQGDAVWQALRKRYESMTAATVERLGGRVVQFTGDGVMAAFATPGRALRTARTLVDDARELGIGIRTGVHVGEAYELGEELSGTCVNIAARVCAAAAAGEVLTTEAVRGMVEGGPFQFVDAGEHDLKGIGRRRLVRLS